MAWVDWYALNVGRERVHACPYPDFPLIELGTDRVEAITPTPSPDAPARPCPAPSSPSSTSTDQMTDTGRRSVEPAWTPDTVVEQRRAHLVLPDGRRPSGWTRGKIGRDGTLLLRVDGDPRRWYRYDTDI
jgi:hypothetical protein